MILIFIDSFENPEGDSMKTLVSGSLILAAGVGLGGCAGGGEQISFRQDVAPILQEHCVSCHQPGGKGYEKSGLSLENYEKLMEGTKFGPVVVPGDPAGSRLNILVEGLAHESMRMPHDSSPLPESKIKILSLWVKQGAKNN